MRAIPAAVVMAIIIATATGLAGCYESPNIKIYKPGVYKGEKDPLVEKQRAPEQQTTLRERFDLVQRDR